MSPVRSRMQVHVADIFHIKTWSADVVVMYLMTSAYKTLSPLLACEHRGGAIVISATWKVLGWTVRETFTQERGVKLYKYQKMQGIL